MHLLQENDAVVIEVPLNDIISAFSSGEFKKLQKQYDAVVLSNTSKTATMCFINPYNLERDLCYS